MRAQGVRPCPGRSARARAGARVGPRLRLPPSSRRLLSPPAAPVAGRHPPLSLAATTSPRGGPFFSHTHTPPNRPKNTTPPTAVALALLACSACASGASAGAVPLWGKKTVSAAAAEAKAAAAPVSAGGDLSYVGKPCPTRAQPPAQTALRLPDDVAGAMVAAIELTLLDGKKMTITRDAVASGRAGAGTPVALAGATRYGGAPLSLGPDVRPNDVASAAVLLRGGKRVELSVPERAAEAADPAGCWKPRKDGPRRAGPTWGGFVDLKARRVLPPVVAVADPAAVSTWAVGATSHPWVDALMASKKKQALVAAVAGGVDVEREDGSVATSGGGGGDGSGSSGDALGDFLEPVFAGGR